ncbi:MAG: hypothetical protein IAF02_16780, partial [Anaerolineae bacterium]|nr:hypothetical protein [Anaerolineae bacterium]
MSKYAHVFARLNFSNRKLTGVIILVFLIFVILFGLVFGTNLVEANPPNNTQTLLSSTTFKTIPVLAQSSGDSSVFLPMIMSGSSNDFSIIFVSRQIPTNGSVYYQQGGMLPGTGSYSRFVVAAPGKLIIQEPNGSMRTLIDGSNPRAASLNLIDVNAPEVSYDGKKIVFAG